MKQIVFLKRSMKLKNLWQDDEDKYKISFKMKWDTTIEPRH